jgi:hypothetical protein
MVRDTNGTSATFGEGTDMKDDKLSDLGPILGEIGAEGAAIVGGDPDRLFIDVEVEDYSIYGAVFKDEGAQVRFYSPNIAPMTPFTNS